MAATVMPGSGKTSFQSENGWLAVIRRLFRSYLSAISSNSTLVSAWSLLTYDVTTQGCCAALLNGTHDTTLLTVERIGV